MRKFLLILTAAFVILASTLPIVAATAGTSGDNYPEIPLYLELQFNDGSSEFMNITDRYYLYDRVNGSTTSLTGRSSIIIKPVGTNVQTDYVLNRKSISTNENGYSVTGFNLTAPTFFLTVNSDKNGFNQSVPRFKIPSYAYATGVITYDVFLGGSQKVGTITRNITSGVGSTNDFYCFTYTELNNLIGNYDWNSCRIDNWKFQTTDYIFSNTGSGSTDVLAGTWILDQSIYPYISGDESYVTLYFNFASNGRNFYAMRFEDGLSLLYVDDTGNDSSVRVWDNDNVDGWINEEYRTIIVPSTQTFEAVVADEYNPTVNGGAALKSWLDTNAIKSGGGESASSPVFEYLYCTKTQNYMHDAINFYFNEWGGSGGDSDQIYLEGYRDGQLVGFDRGYAEGYDEGYGTGTGGGFKLGSFLKTVVGGFFDFQIMPGLSIGGIFGIFIGILIFVAFLKHFAGG